MRGKAATPSTARPAPAPPPAEGHNSLAAIGQEIRAYHKQLRKHAEQAAEYALKQGQPLIEAKKLLGHGRFGDWVEKHCPFNIRMAEYYMRLAKSGRKSAVIARLGIGVAAKGIEEPLDLHCRSSLGSFGFHLP